MTDIIQTFLDWVFDLPKGLFDILTSGEKFSEADYIRLKVVPKKRNKR